MATRAEVPLAVVEGDGVRPWFAPEDLPVELAGAFEWRRGQAVAAAPAVIAVGGRLLVVVPRFYRPIGARATAVQATIQTLVTARREVGRRSADDVDLELAWAGPGVSDLFHRLEAALLLWADFTTNGRLFLTEQRISATERGRIHWPRTIRSQVPAFSGSSVVYAHPLRTRVGLVPEHPLTVLHQRACEEAGQLLGWRPPGGRPVPAAEAVEILDATRHRLFQDRHRRVWQALRRFYASSNKAASSERERGRGCVARSFPHIWERMLDVALAPTLSVRMPVGAYQFSGGGGKNGLSLRPDTVIRHGGRLIVIDAKDYAEGAWPSSGSINKQILYRLCLSDVLGFGKTPLNQIVNAFVRPLALDAGQSVEYLGTHVVGGDARDIGTIHCLGVDFDTVAAAYARGRSTHNLRGLVLEAMESPKERQRPLSSAALVGSPR